MHRTYENEDIVVFWDSDRCRHARKCVQGSPGVFNFTKRPWIDLSGASNPQIWKTVEQCPSGALQIVYRHGIDVVFDEENRRSIALDQDRLIGECDYQETPEEFRIVHTEVLPEYSGKNIGKRLVYCVTESAERRKKTVVPICSYAVKVLSPDVAAST